MIKFSRLKITTILLVVLTGMFFAVPNLFDRSAKEELPGWWQPVSLGLDLLGGSYLLLEVGVEDVFKEQLISIQETIRAALRKERVSYRNLRVGDGVVTVNITNAEREREARQLVRSALQNDGAVVQVAEGGRYRVTLPEDKQRDTAISAVNQSIEIVRRRVDEFGTTEPNIQRQGQDRIIVELPGIDNPERVKEIIGRTAKLNFHLLEPGVGSGVNLEPRDVPAGAMLVPGSEDDPTMYIVERRVRVPGDRLVDSQPTFQDGRPVVSFRFDTAGGRRFGQVTQNNVGQRLAVILDGQVISSPVIRSPILGGSGIIEGGFTVQTAQDLALLLRAGALPAPLTMLEERTVGPGLGADSIRAGAIACGLGLILVVVFMMMTYGLFGVFSTIALMVNLSLLLGVLSALGATLTLPGIAGIVLTVGMAVDANVLIFERMREEVRTGRTLFNALESGFRQAFKTIVDSNLTTLIAAILLFYFGSGPVRGFAVTLGVGIVTSMFTATMVTRLMVVSWLRGTRAESLPISGAVQIRKRIKALIAYFPETFNLRFVEKRKIAAFASAIILLVSMGSVALQGLNFGIDFAGGILMEVRSSKAVNPAVIRAEVASLGLGEVSITTFGDTGRDVSIRIQRQEGGEEAQSIALRKVREALGTDYEYRRTELVGPKVGAELVRDGALAVGLAILAICFYIWVRFEWQFALGATLALTHDVISTVGLFSVLQLDFNLTTVAAILTIAGYSINDTVVAYDRVRENLRKYKKMSLIELLNLSLNNVLSRTILTSLTTLLAVMALYIFGGEVLRGFSFALVWGVIIGTYSSIYVAIPVLIYFNLRQEDMLAVAPTTTQIPEAERIPVE